MRKQTVVPETMRKNTRIRRNTANIWNLNYGVKHSNSVKAATIIIETIITDLLNCVKLILTTRYNFNY